MADPPKRCHPQIRYLEERVQLRGYEGPIRQIAVAGLGRERGPGAATLLKLLCLREFVSAQQLAHVIFVHPGTILEHPKFLRTAAEGRIHLGDFLLLLSQFVFIDASRNLQSLGVICDRDVGISTLDSCIGHSLNRIRSVAPDCVWLEVTANASKTRRIF